MKTNMQFMIRMDDITADMNWDKFNQIKDIFDRYGICPLLGVVPDNQDDKLKVYPEEEKFWSVIQSLQEKGWVIAQHGTYHKYVTTDSGILGLKKASEFAGLSYDEQYNKLQLGKQLLEANGIRTDIFMAPGHTYDVNTIKALFVLGFHTVTDGLYPMPYREEGILFVPCRLQGYRATKGIDTICLHSNHMSDADIRELEDFCKKNAERIVPFQPELMGRIAIKRTLFVTCYEKRVVLIRNIKNKVANSKRLAWYMQRTNDSNSKKKWIKRICYMPILIFGREK